MLEPILEKTGIRQEDVTDLEQIYRLLLRSLNSSISLDQDDLMIVGVKDNQSYATILVTNTRFDLPRILESVVSPSSPIGSSD